MGHFLTRPRKCVSRWDKSEHNDQVHRADGSTRVNVDKQKTVNEGIDAEKPKREPAPVECLVSLSFQPLEVGATATTKSILPMIKSYMFSSCIRMHPVLWASSSAAAVNLLFVITAQALQL